MESRLFKRYILRILLLLVLSTGAALGISGRSVKLSFDPAVATLGASSPYTITCKYSFSGIKFEDLKLKFQGGLVIGLLNFNDIAGINTENPEIKDRVKFVNGSKESHSLSVTFKDTLCEDASKIYQCRFQVPFKKANIDSGVFQVKGSTNMTKKPKSKEFDFKSTATFECSGNIGYPDKNFIWFTGIVKKGEDTNWKEIPSDQFVNQDGIPDPGSYDFGNCSIRKTSTANVILTEPTIKNTTFIVVRCVVNASNADPQIDSCADVNYCHDSEQLTVGDPASPAGTAGTASPAGTAGTADNLPVQEDDSGGNMGLILGAIGGVVFLLVILVGIAAMVKGSRNNPVVQKQPANPLTSSAVSQNSKPKDQPPQPGPALEPRSPISFNDPTSGSSLNDPTTNTSLEDPSSTFVNESTSTPSLNAPTSTSSLNEPTSNTSLNDPTNSSSLKARSHISGDGDEPSEYLGSETASP